MTVELTPRTLLRSAPLSVMNVPGAAVALDAQAPNWIASDDRGLRLLAAFDGRTPLGRIVTDYATQSGLDVAAAWLHVDTFARDALRQGIVTANGTVEAPYLGRSAYLAAERLHELWIQVNDFCNLACGHCLVSSGPTESHGLTTGRLRDVIDQAVTLGVARFFFTGGEPLARPDILDLAEHVIIHHDRELVIMTNGTVFSGSRLDRLRALAGDPPLPSADAAARADGTASEPKLRMQISLDGASATTNDPIRGPGSFDRIVSGIQAAVNAGLRPTLTATILRHNLTDLENFVRLAAEARRDQPASAVAASPRTRPDRALRRSSLGSRDSRRRPRRTPRRVRGWPDD